MHKDARNGGFRRQSAAAAPAFVLAAALSLWPSAGFAAHAGPFRPFLGAWRGAGEITSSNGQTEPIRCRAIYEGGDEGRSLTQSLVCASDSFRLNIEASATANGSAFQGQWQETTRNVQGSLAGEIARGDLEGIVTGSGFTARISIRAGGRRQVVQIQPSGGDIQSVDISLIRQR